MQTFSLFVLLLTASCVAAQTNELNPSQEFRPTPINKDRRRTQKSPCVVVLSHTLYLDGHVQEEPLECELQSADNLNGEQHTIIKVRGLTTKWGRKNNIESGVTTLFASNSVIDGDSRELIIPTNETIKLGRRKMGSRGSGTIDGFGRWDPSDTSWNRKLANVVKRVLVLRIEAADSVTTASESKLADDIFGAAGDPVNLKSQFNQCSYGQLQFEPATSNAIVGSDGVYTVTLPTTKVTGVADHLIASAAVAEAERKLGMLTRIADHIMVCVPPASSFRPGAAAYAYVNHWLSVYDDDYIRYAYVSIHEIGHNLNLAHSSQGSEEYGDASGWMVGTTTIQRMAPTHSYL